jgi:NADH-quinone oxidoreductase subunit C
MSDTSGMPSMVSAPPRPQPAELADPAFDLVTNFVEGAFPDAVRRVVVHRGELTLHIGRERIVEVCRLLRDDDEMRFETLSGVSGVDYPATDDRLRAVYHLLSMTHRRRVRLEVAVPVDDPHVPSVVGVYPTADWHERETYDFFGIIFDGHPALTRIEMPDDWEGYPQRKDYPLGGVPVEYKGAEIPPPDERRSLA